VHTEALKSIPSDLFPEKIAPLAPPTPTIGSIPQRRIDAHHQEHAQQQQQEKSPLIQQQQQQQ
jgi:hypothetical protein